MSGSRASLKKTSKNPFKAIKKAVSMGQGLNKAGADNQGLTKTGVDNHEQALGKKADDGQQKKEKKGKGLKFKSIKNLFKKKSKKNEEKQQASTGV